jgi:hypothetical protein
VSFDNFKLCLYAVHEPHQMKYHENDIKRVRSTDLVQRDASKRLLDKFGDVRTGKFEN